MNRVIIVGLILSLIVSCGQNNNSAIESNPEGQASEDQIVPTLTVDAFDSEAGQYVDKPVAVAGIVDHVCKHSGKRLKLVTDGGSVHVDSEVRFEDTLVGNQILLTGIVREKRIDESSCLQMEEDNIKKHREGATNEEQYNNQQQQIKHYRDSMAVAGVDHLSFYTLEFVSLNQDTK